MSAVDWMHGEWAPLVLSLWACAAAAVAAAVWVARRRAERLLGPGAGPSARSDGLLVAALLLVALGLLGPRLGTRTVRVPASGVDVVLALDVSRSMLARDVPPSRLARARGVADALLAGLAEGDRAALVAYAGRGVLLTPLTPDKDALRALVPALDADLMEAGGSHLEAGVDAAAGAFPGASLRPRVIVVLGDGEDPERTSAVEGGRAAATGARVVGAWFGRGEGAPIPTASGALRDAWGREVRSRADPEALEALARATGGVVLRGDDAGRIDVGRLLAEVRRDAARGVDGTVERRLPVQRSDALAAGALLLLLWIDAPGRMRRRRPSLLARGAVVALAGALLGADAAPDGPDAATLLRLGVERAAAGEVDAARWTFFAAAVRAGEAGLAADAYHDLGVLALEQGELEDARDAFFDALALAPGDRRTQFNLEWTLRALAATPPPPQERRPSDEPDPEPEEPRPDEADPTEPEAQTRRTPRPVPEPDAEREPAERRRTPLELAPDAVERWLDRVKDDPARALRSAARAEGAPEPQSRGPHW